MTYVFYCPKCHVQRPAAPALRGRRVRCPDCFEVVEANESGDLHNEPPSREAAASDTVVLAELDVSPRRADGFDPYELWLGIPADQQPPNFYRLLDLPLFEPDSYVISGAADRQIARLRAVNDDEPEAQERLTEEIRRAKECLTDAEQKATYDRRLHKQFRRESKTKDAAAPNQVAQPVADDADADSTEQTESRDTRTEPADPPAEVRGKAQDEADCGPADGQSVREPTKTSVAASDEEEASAPAPQAESAPPADERKLDAELEPDEKPESADDSRPPVSKPPVVAAPPVIDASPVVRPRHEAPDEDEADSSIVDFSGGRTRFEAEMDMTPMVDVTFLLLIFFMVTASFSLQKTIEQPVQPQDKPSTNVTMQQFEDNPDFVVVQIDEFGTFRVIASEFDEEAPSEQELLIMLRRARQGGGQTPTKLLVAAHGDTAHRRVIMAMDAGTEVGMEQVQFTLAADSEL